MKTKFLLVALAISLGGAISANAQITTGEPSAKVIRTGNRAKAGNFGLYIGATTSMFGNMFKDDVDMHPLPLLNFKYMATNSMEFRVGLEAYKLTERLNGEISQNKSTIASKNKYGESTLILYPGFAYHFSKLNILDVYVGAELPIGWDATSVKSTSAMGENAVASTTTKRSFVIGLGAFIGLQAYIADLPLAIGVEYGLSSRLDAGLKYKNVTVVDNTTTTTYSPDLSKFKNLKVNDDSFSKLAARKGEIGGQVRLTLSYYFK